MHTEEPVQVSNNQDRFAFDTEMLNVDVTALLSYPPFSHIDHTKFPKGKQSVVEVLKHDSRIRHFVAGDVILRQGEYSNSAFIVLRGHAHLVMQQLAIAAEADKAPSLSVWKRVIASIRGGSIARSTPTRRDQQLRPSTDESSLSLRGPELKPQLYLQDIDTLVSTVEGTTLSAGSLFGEVAAMTRSASDYTVVARNACTVLEIRWQGLRQLRRDKAFRQAVDDRYRESSLTTWLSQHPILQYCPQDEIRKIASKASLQSYGEREWFIQYKQDRTARSELQIAAEPLICNEGDHADSLVLVRSGFARKSHHYGHSHRTISYLSQGQLFGLDEICHNAQLSSSEDYLPYQYSLRALGYLDVIRIDRETVLASILPYCRRETLPPPITTPRLDRFAAVTPEQLYQPIENHDEESLLEFLVENRMANAREAMVINTNRCTRCDDCVRACAAGHGGVSRFNRTGPTFNNFMFTESCMHCVDPVCMIGCPTGAIHRDNDTGIVAINDKTCIGCKTCAEACPYSNIVMEVVTLPNTLLPIVQADGQSPMVASKCDLCQNLASGPACVAACPHDALERVDLSNTEKTRNWLRKQ